MSRRSRLELLARLARHEETRALHRLGEARNEVERLQRRVVDLNEAAETSLRGSRAPRLIVEAAGLAADDRHRGALRDGAQEAARQLVDARTVEEQAREKAAQARLRVRAIENAIERREAKLRLERERLQTKRTDESVRAARARRDGDGDALA